MMRLQNEEIKHVDEWLDAGWHAKNCFVKHFGKRVIHINDRVQWPESRRGGANDAIIY